SFAYVVLESVSFLAQPGGLRAGLVVALGESEAPAAGDPFAFAGVRDARELRDRVAAATAPAPQHDELPDPRAMLAALTGASLAHALRAAGATYHVMWQGLFLEEAERITPSALLLATRAAR